MRSFFKYFILVSLAGFLGLMGLLFFLTPPAPKPIPALPFDDKVFVATTPISLAPPAPPATAPFYSRAQYFVFDRLRDLWGPKSSSWTFSASPKRACGVQGLLNQCASVSGTRYLMPPGVAVGIVQFGNTNTLDGPQWVAAFEKDLQKGDAQYLDLPTKQMRPTHFALLRFPAQKTVVVLPESGAADFLRTNGIHLPESKAK
jgi:hypothetical protein